MSENKITEDEMTRKINTNENVGYEEKPLDDDFVLNGNKTENVEKTVDYKSIVKRKLFSRFFIRIFDLVVSGIAILLLLIPFAFISFLIVCDSKGGALFKQVRVGKTERSLKF